MTRPVLLITRRLPDAIEARAARDYDVRINQSDKPTTPQGIVADASGCDAILACASDRLDAAAG